MDMTDSELLDRASKRLEDSLKRNIFSYIRLPRADAPDFDGTKITFPEGQVPCTSQEYVTSFTEITAFFDMPANKAVWEVSAAVCTAFRAAIANQFATGDDEEEVADANRLARDAMRPLIERIAGVE